VAGAGLTEESPAEVYRSLRKWQDAGVIGIVVSGVLIGMANAERLYDSTAFVVKIIALLAGVVLTYGASRPIAKSDGLVSATTRLWFLVGAGLWLVSLTVFSTAVLANPGLFHVLIAAALIVLALTSGRARCNSS
jgi:type IV secretory pathway TrbD component